jgi:hypothetical protein
MFFSPFMTKLTREILDGKANPSRNMWNGKPYRTRAQKIDARREARKCKDGAYRSAAPVSWHPVPRQSAA